MTILLSVDAMGGDHGVTTTIPACIRILNEHPDVNLLLVGDQDIITTQLKKNKFTSFGDRIEIIHTTQVVGMDEPPQSAMRAKKDSSMRVAINLVKQGKANATISSGNTGALMAIARYVLGTMDGIDRPAIAKILPTIKDDVCVLDLGANIECSAAHLLQFGIMGTQLMKGPSGKDAPSVGILNIGSEDIKGHDVLKQAAVLFKESSLNFYGNVEGNDINKGIVDVVVCDGFTGNVALKTLEGTAKMISNFLKEEFNRSITSKLIGLIALSILKRVKSRLDPRKYNGAVLLGLNGLVIKSHGGADELAFYYALKQAYDEVNSGFIPLLKEYLTKYKQEITAEDPSKLPEFDYLSML